MKFALFFLKAFSSLRISKRSVAYKKINKSKSKNGAVSRYINPVPTKLFRGLKTCYFCTHTFFSHI